MSEPATPGARLAGRIALVTGASRGIGAAVAKRFAAEGAELILLARSVSGLEETDNAVRAASGRGALLVPVDLRRFGELDAALHERFGRLDILAGIAGVGGVNVPLVDYKPQEWAEFMAVNLTANWRLIRALDPLLQRSEAGRAVFVTSGAVARIMGSRGAYAVSKAGLEMLVKTYAAEIAKTKVRANLVNPGPVRTDMRAQDRPDEDPMTLAKPEEITDVFVDLADPSCTKNGEVVLA